MARDKTSNPPAARPPAPEILTDSEFDPTNLTVPDGAKDDRIASLESELAALRSDRTKDNRIKELEGEVGKWDAEAKRAYELERGATEELAAATSKLAELSEQRESFNYVIRQLALAVLMPSKKSDLGTARNNALRTALQGMVELFPADE